MDVLIGQDHPVILRPLETRYGSDAEPFAARSILGWTLNCPITSQRTSKHVTSNFMSAASIEHKLDRRRDREQSIEETGSCPDDERVIDLWNKRFRVLDGHIELPIPWKTPHATLPDNLYLAKRYLGNQLVAETERDDGHVRP